MILIPDVKNQRMAVFGLGATGIAVAEALIASGAHVYTWDDNPASREKAKNTAYDPTHPKEWPWQELQFVVLSPGVPLHFPKPHAIVRKARQAKVRIIGDVELFAMAMNRLHETNRPQIIAVTGSNGKSTTTALIAHILAETGREVAMGGNIGTPLLAMPTLDKHGTYVLELSSFQLELAQSLRVNSAVLLNVTPDHLDRHGDMAGYLAAKQRIFYNQTKDDAAIICVDDEHTQGVCAVLSARRQAQVVPVSVQGTLGRGVYALGGHLYYTFGDKNGDAGGVDQITALRGPHNQQNAAAALAAVMRHGVAPSVAVCAMERFEGLAHRMEYVTRLGGVTFVNDSKATNAEAAAAALKTYDNIFWIVGGVAKEGGIGSLKPILSNVRSAYLIGDAAETFASQLAGAVPCVPCGNLAAAVTRASRDAAQSDLPAPVVLLSPAGASYDQFKNFEQRGEIFKKLVGDLSMGVDQENDHGPNQNGGAAA